MFDTEDEHYNFALGLIKENEKAAGKQKQLGEK